MKYIDALSSYLPSLIVHYLAEHDPTSHPPHRQRYDTVCLFADVSGFTALSEAMAVYGPEGAEYLAKHLNSYFGQMVRIIASEGGDIFKFAGDAMIVLWPDAGSMVVRTRRAAQSALAIQDLLHEAELAEGVKLSVKIGIGVGHVSVLHLGGALKRMEYVAVGEPLVQAFGAEHHASGGGEVILSPDAWNLVSSFFTPMETKEGGAVRIESVLKKLKKISKSKMLNFSLADVEYEVEPKVRCYVPGAVLPVINPEAPEEESWTSELRRVTVLFVNLGLKDHDLLAAAQYDEAMVRAHAVFVAVQSAVYQFEGSINKFLMDDKGSTLIAVFGLPPLAHEDDATRGVLCGLAICDRLWNLGLLGSVGITSGVVFCGVVGSTTRKEYSVLGDTVNLSARLMQRMCMQNGGVLCDLEVRKECDPSLSFEPLGEIRVKGKQHPIQIFHPYPAGLIDPLVTKNPRTGHNELHDAYESQLNNLAERVNTTSLFAFRPTFEDEVAVLPANPAVASPPDVPAPKQRRASRFVARPVAKLTTASLALSEHSLVHLHVPRSFVRREDLTSPAVYADLMRMGREVTLEGVTNCAEFLQSAVTMAKDAGLVSVDWETVEFCLQIKDTDFFLPTDKSIPSKHIAAFAHMSHAGPCALLHLLLVRRRDRLILQTRQGMARQRLLELKLQLIENNLGSVCMLEGEMGTGKTDLISEFVNDVLPNTSSMYRGTGSPFFRLNELHVWGAILLQFVRKMTRKLRSAEPLTEEAVVLKLLEPWPELRNCASLLNEVLGLKLKHSEEVLNIPVQEHQLCKQKLVLKVLELLAKDAQSVVILDDALYLDPSSWAIAVGLQNLITGSEGRPGLPLLLIIATRPPPNYVHYLVYPRVPAAFLTIRESPHTHWLRMGQLRPSSQKDLMLRTLGSYNACKVTDVSKRLLDLIASKSLGNPLVVIELTCALRLMTDPPALTFSSLEPGVSRPKLMVDLAATFDPQKDTPLCPSISGMMGMRIDCLSVTLQIILKVCSSIGDTFSFKMLHHVFPIEGHKPALLQSLRKLEDMQIIHRLSSNVDKSESATATSARDSAESKDIQYAFTNGFMRPVLQHRLLAQHREQLDKRVDETREVTRKQGLMEAFEARFGKGKALTTFERTGTLQMRKNINQRGTRSASLRPWSGFRFSEWKKRVLVMKENLLSIFKTDQKTLVQQLPIAPSTTAHRVPDDDFQKKCCFRVDAEWWIKKGKRHDGLRTFFFSADSVESAEEWVLAIQFLTQRQEQQSPRRRAASVASNDNAADDILAAEAATLVGQSRLRILIESAHEVAPREADGTSHPYVMARCGGNRFMTSVVKNSVRPAWKEIFEVVLTKELLEFGGLHFGVYHKDYYESDDLLGQAAIPLATVEKFIVSKDGNSEDAELFAKATGRLNEMKCTNLTLKPPKPTHKTSALGSLRVKALLLIVGEIADALPTPLPEYHPTIHKAEVCTDTLVTINGSSVSVPLLGIDSEVEHAPPKIHGVENAMNKISGVLKQTSGAVKTVLKDAVSILRGGVKPPPHMPGISKGKPAVVEGAAVMEEVVLQDTTSEEVKESMEDCTSSSEEEESAVSVGEEKEEERPAIKSALAVADENKLDDTQKDWLLTQFSTAVTRGVQNHELMLKIAETNKTWGLCQYWTEIYYFDLDGDLQGPFTPGQLVDWHEAGYMSDEMIVRRCVPLENIDEDDEDADEGNSASLGDVLPYLTIVSHLTTTAEQTGLVEWDFDMEALGESDSIPPLVTAMLVSLGLPESFEIQVPSFSAYLSTVVSYMNENPYHNFLHCVDCMQTTYCMLTQMGASAHLSEMQMYSLLMAALSHDLGHPGQNNQYQINTNSDIAKRYANKSVLENYHCALSLELLESTELLQNLSPLDQSTFKEVMVASVLATDMSVHFGLVADLERLVERKEACPEGEEWCTEQDKLFLCKVILHSSDISNPCKPWTVAKRWSDRAVEEFFQQGDLEKEKDLPVTANMDRDTTNQAQLSLNFTDFIVAPLFIALARLLPAMGIAVNHLVKNRATWEGMWLEELKSRQLEAGELAKQLEMWEGRRRKFLGMVEVLREGFSAPVAKPPTPPPKKTRRRRKVVRTTVRHTKIIERRPKTSSGPADSDDEASTAPAHEDATAESKSCLVCARVITDAMIEESGLSAAKLRSDSVSAEELEEIDSRSLVTFALGRVWHTSCLSCSVCGMKLGQQRKCFTKNRRFYCKQHYRASFLHMCALCGQLIDTGSRMIAGGKSFHRGHFRCAHCEQFIEGEFAEEKEDQYCVHHHRLLFHVKCEICGELLKGESCTSTVNGRTLQHHPSCLFKEL